MGVRQSGRSGPRPAPRERRGPPCARSFYCTSRSRLGLVAGSHRGCASAASAVQAARNRCLTRRDELAERMRRDLAADLLPLALCRSSRRGEHRTPRFARARCLLPFRRLAPQQNRNGLAVPCRLSYEAFVFPSSAGPRSASGLATTRRRSGGPSAYREPWRSGRSRPRLPAHRSCYRAARERIG